MRRVYSDLPTLPALPGGRAMPYTGHARLPLESGPLRDVVCLLFVVYLVTEHAADNVQLVRPARRWGRPESEAAKNEAHGAP